MSDSYGEASSPRAVLFGAHRSSTNPRLHAVQKPYNRPASFQGPRSSEFGDLEERLIPSPTKRQQAPTTRPGMTKSSSTRSLGNLPRSGSESSLAAGFRGLKSIFTRPLEWLATPSRNRQKDDEAQWASSNGTDTGRKRGKETSEEPASPTEEGYRGAKKSRRRSPSPEFDQNMDNGSAHGDYLPERRLSITGRAVTGHMLPPLKPDFTLSRSRQPSRAPTAPPNFSRPLPTSQSMSYLDPPGALLSPARNTRSAIKRSSRMDLASLAGDDDAEAGQAEEEDRTRWSPWKGQYSANTRSSITPARQTPIREVLGNDFSFTSGSPFRAPHSPSSNCHSSILNGISRSATTSRLRREGTAVSDISMGRDSQRGGSMRPSTTMLFGGQDDDEMSMDEDRHQGDESVLGYYHSQHAGRVPGSPSSRAATARLSAAPSGSLPPIRRGQLVWDGKGGFVREHDLEEDARKAVHQNEAERILFGLQTSRRTPLNEARQTPTPQGSIPAEIIGSSSRDIRRLVSVPLATSQASETIKQKRDKERLGEDFNVMISPYGRRKVAQKEERQRRREQSASTLAQDEEYQPSGSRMSEGTRMSEAPSYASAASHRSSRSRSEISPSPTPATPRRSARNKQREPSEEPTPKPRSRRGKSKQSDHEPSSTPQRRSNRRGTSEKATSPPPANTASAAPSVPTITETAPSPTTQPKPSGGYQVRDDASGGWEKSSLRAKSAVSKRKHESSVSTRANSPSSGRFSAKEEDLPDMDELESKKIQLPSFSGITFGNLAPPPPKAAPASTSTQSNSLGVPAAQSARPGPSPLSRLNSTRPRSSSPLASGSIVPEPDSPPKDQDKAAAPPLTQDATGFFSISQPPSAPASGTVTPAPTLPPLFSNVSTDKKAAGTGLGIGKPSAAPSAPAAPSFFSSKPDKPAESTTPKQPPPATGGFNFGISSSDKPALPSLSFDTLKKDAPAIAPKTNGSVFGGTPVDVSAAASGTSSPATAPAPAPAPLFGAPAASGEKKESSTGFSFGASKPAEPTKPAFSFGAPSAPPAEQKSTEAPKPAFSFGATAAEATPSTPAPAPAPAAAGGFSFGAPKTASTPAAPPADAPKSTFNFGAAAPAVPTPATSSTPAFNFGGSSAPKPADSATTNGFGGFGANKSTEPPKPADSSSSPFGGFGSAKPAEAPKPAAGGFSFGAPASTTPAASSGTGFTFGQGTPAPPANTFGGFGSNAAPPTSPAPASAPTFSFGSAAPSQPSSNGTTATFTFGAPNPTEPPKNAAPSFGAAPAASTGFNFGSSAPTTPAVQPAQPAQNSFVFGAGNNNASNSSPNAFGAPASNGGFGAPASNGFGAPQPQSPAPQAFGGGFNFGASNSAPTNNASPSFQFGASNSNPNPAPATPAGTGFNFGAPTPTGASQPFQFGASQPSTPAASGSSPFQFGAGAGASSTPTQQPAVRFGSPAPGGADGGFHMGAAPASPSGRQIKPLRRAKK